MIPWLAFKHRLLQIYCFLPSCTQPDNKDDFELPPSWVLPIHISRKGTSGTSADGMVGEQHNYNLCSLPSALWPDFETQCPQGKRTTLYHKSQLDKYAEYLNSDGLVMRLTLYSDTPREHTHTHTHTH